MQQRVHATVDHICSYLEGENIESYFWGEAAIGRNKSVHMAM